MINNLKGFVHLFVIIILALALVGGIGYYAYRNEKIRFNQPSTVSPLSISPSTIPTSSYPVEVCSTITPRWKPTKPKHITIASNQPRDRIYVQFAEGTDIRLREGVLVSLNNADLEQLNEIINQYEVKIERLYNRSEKQLDTERLSGEAMNCKELADLNLAYLFRLSEGQDTEKLIDLLNALPIVELSEPVPIVVNP